MVKQDFNSISDLLDYYSSQVQKELIESQQVDVALNLLNGMKQRCKWRVRDKQKPFVAKLGIPINPFAGEQHTHPAHKTIEESILADLAHLIIEDCTLIFMKEAKARRVRNYHPNQNVQFQLSNFVIVPQDAGRYGSYDHTDLLQHNNIQTETAFIHDGLHYYHPSEMTKIFQNNPNLHTIYATVFCPPELSYIKKNPSIHADLYSIDYIEGTDFFMYTPEGDTTGAYVQDIHTSLAWLETFSVQGAINYDIHLLKSYYAQHVFMITRLPFVGNPIRIFNYPDFTRVPLIYTREQIALPQDFMPKDVMNALHNYAAGVNCNRNSLIQVLRAQEKITGYKLNASLIRYLAEVADQLKDVHGTPAYYPDIANGIWQWVMCKTFYPLYNKTLGNLLDESRKLTLSKLECNTYQIQFNGCNRTINTQEYRPCFYGGHDDYHDAADWLYNHRSYLPHRVCAVLFRGVKFYYRDVHAIEALTKEDYHMNHKDNIQVDFKRLLLAQLLKRLKLSNLLQQWAWQDPDDDWLDYVIDDDRIRHRDGITGNIVDLDFDPTFHPMWIQKYYRYLREHVRPIYATPGLTAAQSAITYNNSLTAEDITNIVITNQDSESDLPAVAPAKLPSMAARPQITQHLPPDDLIQGDFADMYASSNPMNYPPIPWRDNWPQLEQQWRQIPAAQHPYPKQNDCLILSISAALGVHPHFVWNALGAAIPDQNLAHISTTGPYLDAANHGVYIANLLGFRLCLLTQTNNNRPFFLTNTTVGPRVSLAYTGNHFNYAAAYPGGRPFDQRFLNASVELMVTKLGLTLYTHQIDRDRVRKFADDILRSRLGTLGLQHDNTDYLNQMKLLNEKVKHTVVTRSRQVKIVALYGFPGSGKSYWPLKIGNRYLHRESPHVTPRKITFVYPLDSLREDAKDNIDSSFGFCFKTWETALHQRPNATVVFDEISKFPAGYVDSFLLVWPHVRTIVLTGDVLQAVHMPTNPQATITKLAPECDYFARYASVYFLYTHRLSQLIAERHGILTSSSNDTADYEMDGLLPQSHDRAFPSIAAVSDVRESGAAAHTYAGTQGMTRESLDVFLTEQTPLVDERALFTVLTRTTGHTRIRNLMPHGSQLPELLEELLQPDNGYNVRERYMQQIRRSMPHASVHLIPLSRDED